jgi:hypothetical protein
MVARSAWFWERRFGGCHRYCFGSATSVCVRQVDGCCGLLCRGVISAVALLLGMLQEETNNPPRISKQKNCKKVVRMIPPNIRLAEIYRSLQILMLDLPVQRDTQL